MFIKGGTENGNGNGNGKRETVNAKEKRGTEKRERKIRNGK